MLNSSGGEVQSAESFPRIWPALPPGLALRSAHGRYLYAYGPERQWHIAQAPGEISAGSTFKLNKLGTSTPECGLRTWHDAFVSARGPAEGWVINQVNVLQGGETFHIEHHGSNWIAIKTAWNKYLSARPESEGWAIGQVDVRTDWEVFTVVDVPLPQYQCRLWVSTSCGGEGGTDADIWFRFWNGREWSKWMWFDTPGDSFERGRVDVCYYTEHPWGAPGVRYNPEKIELWFAPQGSGVPWTIDHLMFGYNSGFDWKNHIILANYTIRTRTHNFPRPHAQTILEPRWEYGYGMQRSCEELANLRPEKVPEVPEGSHVLPVLFPGL